MGEFLSSPEVKIHDAYIPDRRRYQKMDDIDQAEHLVHGDISTGTLVATLSCHIIPEEALEANNLQNGHLLSGLHLHHQTAPPRQSFKNLINGHHRAYPRSPDNNAIYRSLYPEQRPATGIHSEKHVKVRKDITSPSQERLSVRPRKIQGSTRSISAVSSHSINDGKEKSHAENVTDRFDTLALVKLGKDYIDTIAQIADVNHKIVTAQKSVRKKLKCERLLGLIALNIVQCFKKVFYILRIHDKLCLSKTGKGSGKGRRN